MNTNYLVYYNIIEYIKIIILKKGKKYFNKIKKN